MKISKKQSCFLVLALIFLLFLTINVYSNTCYFTDSGATGFFNNDKNYKAKCTQNEQIVTCNYRNSAKDWICTGPEGQKHDPELEIAIAEACGCY